MAKLTVKEMWEQMLTGDYPRLQRYAANPGSVAVAARCKLYDAPFRGPGGLLMRAIAYGRRR